MKKYIQLLVLLIIGASSLSQCAWRDWFYQEYFPLMPSEMTSEGAKFTPQEAIEILEVAKGEEGRERRENLLEWARYHGYGAPELQLKPGVKYTGYVAGALALLGAGYVAYRYMFPGKPLPATEELANAEVEAALNAEEKQKAAELASAVILAETAAEEIKKEEIVKPSLRQRKPEARTSTRAGRSSRTRSR